MLANVQKKKRRKRDGTSEFRREKERQADREGERERSKNSAKGEIGADKKRWRENDQRGWRTLKGLDRTFRQ